MERVHLRQIYTLGKETETLRAEGPSGRVEILLHQKQCPCVAWRQQWRLLSNSSESAVWILICPFPQHHHTNPGLIFLWIFLSICRKYIFPCNPRLPRLHTGRRESVISKDKWISLLKCKLSHCGTISGLRTHFVYKRRKLPYFQIWGKTVDMGRASHTARHCEVSQGLQLLFKSQTSVHKYLHRWWEVYLSQTQCPPGLYRTVYKKVLPKR